MAWAFDAAGGQNRIDSPSTTDPQVWSHTCSGSDRLLPIGISFYQTGVQSINGITYNGVSVTQLATFSPQNRGGTGNSFWYLVGPSTGTNNVSVDMSAPAVQFMGTSVSYTGVDQTPIIRDSDGYNYNGTSGQITLTGLTVGDLIVGICGGQGGGLGGGAGTTSRRISSQLISGDVNAAASSDTIDFTHSNDNFGMMAAAFAEAGGGGGGFTPTPMLHMMQIAGGLM